ncbi:MAG: hypothetical protein M3261_01105, partial [Thermoproteota archaeon]|nr:hypothetical protein [Thermoproteota archaeon]
MDAPAHEMPFPSMTVPAHASTLFALMVLYDWHAKRFLFSEAGTYQLTLTCSIPVEEANGKVAVRLAGAQATVMVQDYLGKDKDLWQQSSVTTLPGQDLPGEALQNLTELVEQFPRSPYRPYAMAIIGGAFIISPKGITAQQQITVLEELIKQYPQFAWKDIVAARLYELLMNAGEVGRAKEMIKIALDDPWFPPTLKNQLKQFQPPVLFPQD